MTVNPYVTGLSLLARRELSGAQLRQKLLRKGFQQRETDSALKRLQREGALDDNRTAALHARQAALNKCRGPRRIVKEIEAKGIAHQIAVKAVSELCEELDVREMLVLALNKRLTGQIRDRAEFRRLYNYLVRQGFDGHQVLEALRTRSGVMTTQEDV